MSEDYEKRIAELETEYSQACEQVEVADIRLRDVMQDIARLRVARIAELEAQVAGLKRDCDELIERCGVCSEEVVDLLNGKQRLDAQVTQLREALEGILGVSGGLATREDYDRALRVLEATKPDGE